VSLDHYRQAVLYYQWMYDVPASDRVTVERAVVSQMESMERGEAVVPPQQLIQRLREEGTIRGEKSTVKQSYPLLAYLFSASWLIEKHLVIPLAQGEGGFVIPLLIVVAFTLLSLGMFYRSRYDADLFKQVWSCGIVIFIGYWVTVLWIFEVNISVGVALPIAIYLPLMIGAAYWLQRRYQTY